jgi:type IV secretory pathway VirJ component
MVYRIKEPIILLMLLNAIKSDLGARDLTADTSVTFVAVGVNQKNEQTLLQIDDGDADKIHFVSDYAELSAELQMKEAHSNYRTLCLDCGKCTATPVGQHTIGDRRIKTVENTLDSSRKAMKRTARLLNVIHIKVKYTMIYVCIPSITLVFRWSSLLRNLSLYTRSYDYAMRNDKQY